MKAIRISALMVLSAVLSAAPRQDVNASPAAIASRAMQLQQSGDNAGAAGAYRELIKIDPNQVAAHVNLAIVLVQSGHYDEALAEYAAADKLLPGDPRIALNIGLAYMKSGRIREAGERFESLHSASPEDTKATMLLADCNLQLGNDKRVIELLWPLEAKASAEPGVLYMLGMALLRSGQLEEGEKLLDQILRNGDTAESRFLLGTRMYESHDYPAAVKQLASAIELNPHLPGLQAYYGLALLNTGDPDAASGAFHKELEANPSDYEANLSLGQILVVRKQFSEAEPLFQRALLSRPGSAEAELGISECRRRAVRTFVNSSETPEVNARAPDFKLPDSQTGRDLRLADFQGKSPVVLVFGSYSCPNFRASAAALNAMHEKYARQTAFVLVYIREAHADGNWQSTRNEREGVAIAQAASMAEKEGHAAMCSRKLHLNFPAVVDGMDGAIEAAYHAWPSRAFIIDTKGRVRYSTRLTELDFRPDEMESVLRQVTNRGIEP